jgi:hypothetical protein
MREAARMTTRSARLSVTLLIVGVDRAARRRQMSTHMLVTPAVLGQTMNENHRTLNLLGNPGPAKQQMTRRPGQVGFRSTDLGLFQTKCALKKAG